MLIMRARGLFKIYQGLLVKRPVLMQAIQAGTMMGLGDIISQTLVEKRKINQIEPTRTLRFASIGFCIAGPGLRTWYGVLQKFVGQSGKTVALKKVIIDQTVFAPCFLFLLLVTIGFMQGKNFDSVKKDMENNYLDVLKNNYLIWPWVQIVNFYYVPLHYQVLVVQFVALFWNTYLSWKTNRDNQVNEKESTL